MDERSEPEPGSEQEPQHEPDHEPGEAPTASEWSVEAEEAAPRKKKRIPVWVWGCGGGCLLAVLIAVIAFALLFDKVKDMFDPEVQWQHLAEILPYDERPANLEPQMGFGFFGAMDMVALHDTSAGLIFVVMEFKESDKKDLEKLFVSGKSGGIGGFGDLENARPGTLLLQEREVRLVRADSSSGGFGNQEAKNAPQVWVDLTGDASHPLVAMIVSVHGKDEVTDEEIQNLLAPFHVWGR